MFLLKGTCNRIFCFQKTMSHFDNFFPKKNCIQEVQLFSPPLYCIAFAQLYSWKLFEFEFFNVMSQWNVIITKERKFCVQFITFQNPTHKALTFPWKCNLKFPCSSPLGQCHDVNEDWFWHQVFQLATSTQLNVQEFKTTTPLAIANNITMRFSKKYPSGSLELTMGKFQTLLWSITNTHQENFSRKKTSNLGELNPRN
jgi:hypothetical protein